MSIKKKKRSFGCFIKSLTKRELNDYTEKDKKQKQYDDTVTNIKSANNQEVNQEVNIEIDGN